MIYVEYFTQQGMVTPLCLSLPSCVHGCGMMLRLPATDARRGRVMGRGTNHGPVFMWHFKLNFPLIFFDLKHF